MLAGQVGAHDLWADVGRGQIDAYAFPAAFPIGVGEKTAKNFCVKIRLARKVAVEAAVGEAGSSHNLLHRNVVEAVAVEETAGAVDDLLFDFFAVA